MHADHFYYLDYNATTPVDEKVLKKMLPLFSENFANPSSNTHRMGRIVNHQIDTSLKSIAHNLGVDATELVITSGATESINLAIRGVAEKYSGKGQHFITAENEHKAVLDTFKSLEQKGAKVTYLSVNKDGRIASNEFQAALRPDTVMCCIMLANNETGIIQNIAELSNIAHQNGTIFMSDTTQAYGKIPVDLHQLGIDVACLSAHKFYGPKGVGALYLRRKQPRVVVSEQITGGGHQRGRRSGTLNAPGIIGLAECTNQFKQWNQDYKIIEQQRNHFESLLKQRLSVEIIGEQSERLPNTSMVIFKGMKAEKLITNCPELQISMGSACTSANPEPSHVLKSMGYSDEETLSAVRFSFGKNHSNQEIEQVVDVLVRGVYQ